MKDDENTGQLHESPETQSSSVSSPSTGWAGGHSSDDSLERLTQLTEINRQLKRKIFDLYTIFEISRNFNSVLEYQSLLDSFIFTSLAQVSATRGAIFLKADGQPDRFEFVKGKGFGQAANSGMAFEGSSRLLEYLRKLNRPLFTSELIAGFADEREKMTLQTFHPGLAVPLIHKARLSGLLIVADKLAGRDFTLDDVEFLSILGNQISVAIENARLYEAERQATAQLRATQQQLVASERLAALGEMSAKVAHEVNNPLGIISNYLLLLKRATRGNVEGHNYVDVVTQEIGRIARIVQELLDFHRPNGMTYQPTDVAAVIDDTLRLMEQKCNRQNIEINRHFEPECPAVPASPEHLKQVFLNLLINACDAMSSGGRLTVSVEAAEGHVRVRFEDTGPGIPPETIPHIFEPFFTTKKPGQGTGLGLSVCYGIIRRHQGTISFHNTENGGCFEILLPAGTKGANAG